MTHVMTVGDLMDFLATQPRSLEVVVEGTPSDVAYGGVVWATGPCGDEDRAQRAVLLKAYVDIYLAERTICERCGDTKVITVAEHDCGGDERRCETDCPVPVQTECPDCTPKPIVHTASGEEEPF